MWLSASKRVLFAGLGLAALMAGQAMPSHAQSLDDPAADLRLETTTDDALEDEVLPPPPPVAAQPITIGDDVPERPRRRPAPVNPYEPLGLRTGAFTLFPTLEIGAGLRLTDTDAGAAETEAIARLRPGIRAESNWSRHRLTLNGAATLDQTFGGDDDLTISGNLGADLRLDVRRGTTADFAAGYRVTAPDSGTGNDPGEHTLTGSAALTHDLGGVAARLRVGATHQMFEDTELSGGGTVDNSDRTYTELSVALRGSLTREAFLSPFAEVAYEPRFYAKKLDRNGIARSSQGARVSVGVAINDDPLWTGELAASLLYRNYDDSSLDDALAPGLSAALTWRPTDLTRFEFNAGVSLEETIAAGESATAQWTAGFRMAHDLRENLTLSAGLSFTKESGASDTLTLGSELGLSWAMNRNMVLGLSYASEYRDGASDSQEHSLIGSIILRR